MSLPTAPVRLLLLLLLAFDARADGRLAEGGLPARPHAFDSVQRASSNQLVAPVSTEPALSARTASAADDAPPPLAAPPSSPAGRVGSLLSLLGNALFGGLLLGSGSGLGGGLLFTVLAVLAGGWLLRRFLSASEAPPPALRTEPAGWMPAPPPQANPVPPIARSAPNGASLRLPPGFDLSAFLREARLSFVRLQSANDRADIADLREFTTPQMFAALALEIQGRSGTAQRVEVMALDAQLLDLGVEHEEALASVRFHGSARQDQGPPEPFTEVWHVRKRLSDPGAVWLLDGIQQSS